MKTKEEVQEILRLREIERKERENRQHFAKMDRQWEQMKDRKDLA